MMDPLLKRAIDFHGHHCFGLSVGYAASKIALDELGLERASDEELVVIGENDSCAIDAIQIVAGATIGRGNLIIKDWGKHGYTFISRDKGRSIRLLLDHDALSDITSKEERIAALMERGGKFFHVNDVEIDIPPKARVSKAQKCSDCGEYAARKNLIFIGKKSYCRPCYEKVYIQAP